MTEFEDTLQETVAELVAALDIPPCPEVISKVIRESVADEPDLARIADWISSDPSLAAMTMQAANSALYAPARPIESIRGAIAMLGCRTVTSLVRNLMLRRAFPRLSSPGMQRFWTISAARARTAAVVAQFARGIDCDTAYTFGLFVDCGMPVLRAKHEAYECILLGATGERGARLVERERRDFGVAHVDVGATLAARWHLPPQAVEAIRISDAHAPIDGESTSSRLAALGRIAECVLDHNAGEIGADWCDECSEALESLEIDEVDALRLSEAAARLVARPG